MIYDDDEEKADNYLFRQRRKELANKIIKKLDDSSSYQ